MENYKGTIVNNNYCCCCCNGKNNAESETVQVGTVVYAHILQLGYVKANGDLLNRSEYADLYEYAKKNSLVLSETDWANDMQGMFAEGDGVNTFRVPDLRGQFLRGMDDGAGFDLGRSLGSKQSQSTMQHQHEVPVPLGTYAATIHRDSWEFGVGKGKSRVANTVDKSLQCESGGVALSSPNRNETGETRPANIALIAQIKY